MRGRVRLFLATVLCAASALAIGASPASAARFCQTGTLVDYMKPLERMPPLRHGPKTQRLPFGPGNVSFIRSGSQLVAGGEKVGFHLDYTRSARHRTSQPLNWLVTAKLMEVDSSGRPRGPTAYKQLDGLRFPTRATLDFSLPGRPAFYRLEIVFRNGAGTKLARYGEYLRALSPGLEAHLTLEEHTFRPGDTVEPWLENPSPYWLFYGLAYSIERFEGESWSRASIGPHGLVPLIGIWGAPGAKASCWTFQIPTEAEPGLYRFVLAAHSTMYGRPAQRKRLTLTAEFEIVAAS